MNGTIRKRNNGYQLIVSLGSESLGTRKRFYRTIKNASLREAKKELEKFYLECVNNQVQHSSSITFGEFVEIWEKEYAHTQLKRSTYVIDKKTIDRNFQVFFKKKLSSIKPLDIRKWLNFLQNERGLSPKTIKNNYSLLHKILQKAVHWDYLTKNPADNMELPKIVRKEAEYYTSDDVHKLLEALKKQPIDQQNYKVAVLIALFGGLRRGELCGLDESDVDFDEQTIHIRQTRLVNNDAEVFEKGIYIDTPKTLRSVRTISFPPFIMSEIEKLLQFQSEQKKKLGNLWLNSPALLKSEIGGAIYPQLIYRWFIRIQKKNDLPRIPLKGLRHTHASMLVDCQLDLEGVSKRMGHSQKTTTLNIYSHLYEDRDKHIANTLDELYFKEET